jgi:hypothetical protein
LLLSAGCASGGGAGETNLTGTAEEVLTKLTDDIAAAGVEGPKTITMPVTADIAQNMAGLSEESFGKLIASAATGQAAIGTFAHQLVVYEANSAKDAAEVKKLVTGDGGYDANKWICVAPDKAVAVESGNYVLLVASKNDYCDAAIAAFTEAAGTTGEPVVFYQSA